MEAAPGEVTCRAVPTTTTYLTRTRSALPTTRGASLLPACWVDGQAARVEEVPLLRSDISEVDQVFKFERRQEGSCIEIDRIGGASSSSPPSVRVASIRSAGR